VCISETSTQDCPQQPSHADKKGLGLLVIFDLPPVLFAGYQRGLAANVNALHNAEAAKLLRTTCRLV
jgi:hypothetical protein